ncbi:hypothetical protein EAY39_07795 [Vibrio anguillarum]|nr:hypothetical protein [Vibrio anguillarum]
MRPVKSASSNILRVDYLHAIYLMPLAFLGILVRVLDTRHREDAHKMRLDFAQLLYIQFQM